MSAWRHGRARLRARASEQPVPHISGHPFSEHVVSETTNTQLPGESARPGSEPGDCWLQPTEEAGQKNAAAELGSWSCPRALPVGPVIVQAAPEASREPEAPAPAPGSSCVTCGSVFLSVLSVLASQVALAVMNPPANAGDTRCGFNPWVGKIPWRRAWQPAQCSCLEHPWTEEPSGLQRVRHG